MMSGVDFRTMQPDELAVALEWAAEEGWNPGLDDAEVFWHSDPQGFFLAEAEGRPVAAISVVNHSTDFAFLGLYLCLPEFRGKGIGYRLWQHALNHAGERTVGLDGVPDQQANYRKSGFDLTGQTYRFLGDVEGHMSAELRNVNQSDLSALIRLDSDANGYAKPAFLRNWLVDTPTRKTLVLGDEPRGYATIRACRSGHKIGPVVAPTLKDAEALIRGVVQVAQAQEVMIDVPDDCAPLMNFCQATDMTVTFNTARMYRGAAPKPGELLRSIATMELG